jgi:hypothetical protein
MRGSISVSLSASTAKALTRMSSKLRVQFPWGATKVLSASTTKTLTRMSSKLRAQWSIFYPRPQQKLMRMPSKLRTQFPWGAYESGLRLPTSYLHIHRLFASRWVTVSRCCQLLDYLVYYTALGGRTKTTKRFNGRASCPGPHSN